MGRAVRDAGYNMFQTALTRSFVMTMDVMTMDLMTMDLMTMDVMTMDVGRHSAAESR
jgi:hypothetical protein